MKKYLVWMELEVVVIYYIKGWNGEMWLYITMVILYLCSNHSQQHVQQCHVTCPTAQKQFQFQIFCQIFFQLVHYLDYDIYITNGVLGNLFWIKDTRFNFQSRRIWSHSTITCNTNTWLQRWRMVLYLFRRHNFVSQFL